MSISLNNVVEPNIAADALSLLSLFSLFLLLSLLIFLNSLNILIDFDEKGYLL